MTMAAHVEQLASWLGARTVAVLTGAGCSTESGIPDYRGPTAPKRVRKPMQYAEFMGSSRARQRYWARATLGWPRFVAARPNPTHVGLAALQQGGVVASLITQNVDRLHQAAGSDPVNELHGALAEVRCMKCEAVTDRAALHGRLLERNSGWADTEVTAAPDGDADLDDPRIGSFVVADCENCGGVLKPHVVFFGESVPRAKVETAYAAVASSDALLVVGSSLTVFSGYRFARAAAAAAKPIAVVNLGPTRADPLATLRIEAVASELISGVARRLCG